MAVRPAKRPRSVPAPCDQRGEDDYLPGNIVEIEIHNFMTYDHLVCKPGPRLNLVIGPNGSGKSSLVCAIALGLAGEPQLLGRASSIGAFVKRGEECGYIKISLRGFTTEEKIMIMRKINTSNKSEWTLNGIIVPKRDVIEIIQKFNIQVNNLTQFLPQDRVCEFAKLTPIQLLEETEKAVGDPELPVQHHTLICKRKELKDLELSVAKNNETLNQLKTLNAQQEKDVERVRQRKKILTEVVENMKKKLPWLKYDLKKVSYKKVQKQEAEAKRMLEEAAKTMNELMKPIEKHKEEKVAQESAVKKVNDQITKNSHRRMEFIDIESRMGIQVRGKYQEVEDLRRQDRSRQQRILKAKEELAAAEKDLVDLPRYEPPKEELEKLGSQILELEMNANQIKLQRTEKGNLLHQKNLSLKKCLDRLKEMNNEKSKLLQTLKNSGVDKIFEAYNWLQVNRHELKREVYGPVLSEVKVSNGVHATYLENHVPFYIWKSFVTQDSFDRDLLVNNLKKYDVPILNYVGGRGLNKSQFHITHEMNVLGISSRLDQVFTAPDAVKDVLISQAALDHSYIGTRETDKRADEVSRLGINDLWTPESHYRWSVSRYGGHVSAIMEPVHSARLFVRNVDVSDVESLRSRKNELEATIIGIEESLKIVQVEQRQLEDEAAKLHRQREEIINAVNLAKKKRRELESIVDQRKRKLESLSKEEDLESSVKKLVDLAFQLDGKRCELSNEIKASLVEAIALRQSFTEKHMTCIELDAKIREMEVAIKQHEKIAIQAASHLEICKEETERCKHELYVAKQHAESVVIITDDLVREFEKMPGTVEELEAAIQDGISEANSILFLNQNILEEYESRQNKIVSLETKLKADEEQVKECVSDINTLRDQWLPTLRNLVVKINATFSCNFREMAIAGEICLDEHGMDYDRYGILIKVKFRLTGQLQALSSHHQSGGERSVSTILYLVSLQDITNCPFRVVDEINQGMDPINERKMFQQLVRAASQENTPQCFLLTPKLLPDLQYSDACSILNIMNGPWIEKSAEGKKEVFYSIIHVSFFQPSFILHADVCLWQLGVAVNAGER
ncbi:Structural maintenance of chromosomes protein 2-2 [Apostasia shenzhenica]|uniref:Structural maintenance of chromosomes protein 5 n=1 Tax=Apostasia shenzhenica TaxID=1088818 RepID=A0A2I0A4I8_9ASPA|nr:Structural maintenance of chromosomes protein 2-2 [Apostasia shenzhenica]